MYFTKEYDLIRLTCLLLVLSSLLMCDALLPCFMPQFVPKLLLIESVI